MTKAKLIEKLVADIFTYKAKENSAQQNNDSGDATFFRSAAMEAGRILGLVKQLD